MIYNTSVLYCNDLWLLGYSSYPGSGYLVIYRVCLPYFDIEKRNIVQNFKLLIWSIYCWNTSNYSCIKLLHIRKVLPSLISALEQWIIIACWIFSFKVDQNVNEESYFWVHDVNFMRHGREVFLWKVKLLSYNFSLFNSLFAWMKDVFFVSFVIK